MEKFPEKFNPLEDKFIEAIHKKKAETESDYEDENPATAEEVIEDLKEMGVVKEKELKSSLEKDAEDIVKAVLGKDAFERSDKIESPKDKSKEKTRQKPYIYREIDRLGEKLAYFSKKTRETQNKDLKDRYKKEAEFFLREFEKAKAVRDKNKSRIE